MEMSNRTVRIRFIALLRVPDRGFVAETIKRIEAKSKAKTTPLRAINRGQTGLAPIYSNPDCNGSMNARIYDLDDWHGVAD